MVRSPELYRSQRASDEDCEFGMSPKPVFEGKYYPLSTDVAVLVKRCSHSPGARPSVAGDLFCNCNLWRKVLHMVSMGN